MKVLLLLLILFISGCTTLKYPDNTIIKDHTPMAYNATVEEFCKVKGNKVEFYRNGKVWLSR